MAETINFDRSKGVTWADGTTWKVYAPPVETRPMVQSTAVFENEPTTSGQDRLSKSGVKSIVYEKDDKSPDAIMHRAMESGRRRQLELEEHRLMWNRLKNR